MGNFYDEIVSANYKIIEDNMIWGAVDLVFSERGHGKLEQRYLHPKDLSLGVQQERVYF